MNDCLPQDENPDPHLEALRRVITFVRDHHEAYIDDEATDLLLMFTTMRSTNTASALSNLLLTDSIEQAQMLCRPLFEDMAVMHWLVMQKDPSFLLERFFDHQDAIAVNQYDYVTGTMGLPHPGGPGLPESLANRDKLRQDFGRHAERPWWDARPDGRPIRLSGIIDALETHPPYIPRLHGGAEPALRLHYNLANKMANQQLHHTPEGLPFALTRHCVRRRNREALRANTAFNAFWSLGQIAYLQLEYGTRDATLSPSFDSLFQEQMRHVFSSGMSEEQVRDALAEARSRQSSDESSGS